MDVVQRKSGFTLVEILVVITIIGILASIVYPSYQQYLVKANRAAAQQFLLEATSVQHQYFLANNGNGYAHKDAINSLVSTSANVSTYYDITFLPITDTTSSSFTIIATPLTSSIQQNDGYLSITNTGLKTGTW